jgi:hypothetical protein
MNCQKEPGTGIQISGQSRLTALKEAGKRRPPRHSESNLTRKREAVSRIWEEQMKEERFRRKASNDK